MYQRRQRDTSRRDLQPAGRRGWRARHVRSALATAAMTLLIAPLPAAARVYVDPHGPAGKEYGVPVDAARGEAAGSDARGVPGQTESPPLFGQGTGPPDGAQPSPAEAEGGGTDGATDAAPPGEPASKGSQGEESGGSGLTAVNLRHEDGGGDPGLAAVVAAVVALGAGLGFAMRRFVFRPGS